MIDAVRRVRYDIGYGRHTARRTTSDSIGAEQDEYARRRAREGGPPAASPPHQGRAEYHLGAGRRPSRLYVTEPSPVGPVIGLTRSVCARRVRSNVGGTTRASPPVPWGPEAFLLVRDRCMHGSERRNWRRTMNHFGEASPRLTGRGMTHWHVSIAASTNADAPAEPQVEPHERKDTSDGHRRRTEG